MSTNKTLHIIQPSALDGYKLLLKRPHVFRMFAIVYLIGILAYFTYTNLSSALSLLSFMTLGTLEKIKLFLTVLFDTSSFDTPYLLPLVVSASFGTALVITQFHAYFSLRKSILIRDGVYGGFALLLAILGVGCAACGTLIISSLASFFGYAAILRFFPYHGIELGYLGVVLLATLSYMLALRYARITLC